MITGSKARRVCAMVVVVAAAACGRPADRALASPGALRGANVLLITIDTLRQDRVGAYGNRNGLTPTIDRLAAGGIRYAHAFSPAPLTLPAHASIMTGLLPRSHGIHSNTRFRLDEHVPTLASMLKRAGYRTGAFVGAFVLDGRFGLNQGFDQYDDRLPRGDRASFHFAERRAAEVVALAGDWILSSPQPPASSPWFAWVHLFDPHAPYDAPVEYRTGRSPYDAEVAYTDAMLGQLLARLDATHALTPTLIVLTADHGESLGDHGEMTHGLFAYDSTLAVPLIVNAPSLAPAVVDAPVSHPDVTPTILDLLGLAPPGPADGQSLLRSPAPDRPLYFEALDASLTRGWAPLRGIVQSGWKYIDLPDPELYDLRTDPGEQHNRVDRDPHADLLKRALRLATSPETTAPRLAMETEAAARLRSLGYSTGSSPRAMNAGDDPKRMVGLNERFNTALTTFDEGQPQPALAAFLAILRERPDFVAARASASTVLIATGRTREAIDLLRDGLRQQPDSSELLAKLGSALGAAGDSAGSIDAFERARRAGGDDPDVLNQLAVVLAGSGRASEARAIFHTLIDRNPGAATAWFNLGLFELQSRRRDEAVAAFRRATAIDPSYGEAWNALGAALVDRDAPGAIDAWRRAERLVPRDYDLLFNLGMLLADSRTPSEAIPYLRRFAQEAPPDKYASDMARVASTLARLKEPVR
ncbi:MAG TPA: sulfatase-like hydrolase/transferase [Vicinamibacterales bacterium]|nr:sulfatase-like hydrolase/transferase [Vicinamibacterales bacterium]